MTVLRELKLIWEQRLHDEYYAPKASLNISYDIKIQEGLEVRDTQEDEKESSKKTSKPKKNANTSKKR